MAHSVAAHIISYERKEHC